VRERAHALAEAANAALPAECDEPAGWLLAAALARYGDAE
jgi:hypothetical protein